MPAPTNRRPGDIVRAEDVNDVARVANSAETRVGAVETQVNGRLSETSLTTTIATEVQRQYDGPAVEAAIEEAAAGLDIETTTAALSARPAMLDDYTARPDGPAPAKAYSGHPYTYRLEGTGTGYRIAGGALVHDPAADGSQGASYAGVVLPRKVRRVWATVVFPSGAGKDELLALAISEPGRPFTDPGTDNSFPRAGAHVLFTRTGWTYQTYNSPGTTTISAAEYTGGALAHDTPHTFEVIVDGDVGTVVLPDGKRFSTPPTANIAAWSGPHATLESFHSATATPPNKSLRVLAWGAEPVLADRAAPATRTETGRLADLVASLTAAVDILKARADETSTYLLLDNFTTDAPTLGTAETGQAWTGSAGTFKKAGGKAIPSAAENTRALVDVGVTDVAVSAIIGGTPTAAHYVLARAADASNYYRFGIASDGSLALQAVVGGSVARTVVDLGALPTTGQTITLRCKGTTLTMLVDGVIRGTVTDTNLTTGTQVGMQALTTTAAFDRVSATAL